ncbi:MAG: photosynthetic complex assembly protein PuhC [Hyphomicrobium sp.]
MSDAIDAQPFPKGILISAGCLLALTMASAGLARWSDIGATRLDLGTPVISRELRFAEQPGGHVIVTDATNGDRVADIPPKGNGFVTVVVKGFARDRSLAGISPDTPFRLHTFSNGTSAMEDPATGRMVTLGSFGADNLKAFTQLIAKGRTPQ